MLFRSLTKISECHIQSTPVDIDSPQSQSVASTVNIQLVLPAIDVEKEKERLSKQLDQLNQQKQQLDKKLMNEQFLEKAPVQVVEKVKSEAESVASEINSLEQQIAQFV